MRARRGRTALQRALRLRFGWCGQDDLARRVRRHLQRGGRSGHLSAILLLALYLGRLIVFDPTKPVILVPALLNGFLINPIFYVWLGLALLRGRTVHEARTGAP